MLATDDLRFFLAVAEAPSLAAASRALDVSPPAVTQRLRALEERLGTHLVDRAGATSRSPTRANCSPSAARAILDALGELDEALAARRGQVVGHLRVVAPLGFGRRHVAPVAAAFQAAHPGVAIDLTLSDCLGGVPEGTFDLAVHVGEIAGAAPGLIAAARPQRPDRLRGPGLPRRPGGAVRARRPAPACLHRAARERRGRDPVALRPRRPARRGCGSSRALPATTARWCAAGRSPAGASSCARNGTSPTTCGRAASSGSCRIHGAGGARRGASGRPPPRPRRPHPPLPRRARRRPRPGPWRASPRDEPQASRERDAGRPRQRHGVRVTRDHARPSPRPPRPSRIPHPRVRRGAGAGHGALEIRRSRPGRAGDPGGRGRPRLPPHRRGAPHDEAGLARLLAQSGRFRPAAGDRLDPAGGVFRRGGGGMAGAGAGSRSAT